MARARGQSFGDGIKTPHSISLKVLRLTRPSLATQYPLPLTEPPPLDGLSISLKASLAYPESDSADAFILTPILQLPESFQSAYVGETFSATLCANSEHPVSPPSAAKTVTSVKVQAEMQTPSGDAAGQALELEDAGDAGAEPGAGGDDGRTLGPGQTMQKILRLNLKEEGNHTLGVTVTYTEPADAAVPGEAEARVGKVRTFRKLYQFVALPLLGVRTKAGDLPAGENGKFRFVVEAQLENVGERAIVLEAVSLAPKAPFASQSLNWDIYGTGADPVHAPILNPRDVIQVAFLLEEQTDVQTLDNQQEPAHDIHAAASGDKIILGQLNIQWTSAMGDRGSLSTGWLIAKKR